jgi:NAD+-dependent secondary alcohol dehydrogenase Adh1
MVMGHENAGWVEEVGKDVTGFKKGDPVILHPIISGTDGTCLNCRRGLDQHADDVAFPGLNIKEGGYAELLKTSVRNLIKLPTVLAPKDVAPFSDAGLTCI